MAHGLPDEFTPATLYTAINRQGVLFLWQVKLPLSPSGKIDRRALPAPAWSSDADPRFVAPRNEIEEVVAAVWSEVLGIARIGVETSFFDLGGHSLLATRIAGQVTKIFRTPLPLRRFFEAPTIAGIAHALTGSETRPKQALTIARLFQKAQRMTPDERVRLRHDANRTGRTPDSP